MVIVFFEDEYLFYFQAVDLFDPDRKMRMFNCVEQYYMWVHFKNEKFIILVFFNETQRNDTDFLETY